MAPLSFLAYKYARGIWAVLTALILPLVPISIGIAILRYRLYEIDRIINRTLVYGLLTMLLGLCYVAGSLVFVEVAGADTDPPSWLVAATLPAAAVFRPGAASRLWWIGASTGAATTPPRRSRRSAPAFATRSTWTPSPAELVAVADHTMEPTVLLLWLRPRRRHQDLESHAA